MKYFILFSLLTTSAFAIDFQKTTGTFDVKEPKTLLGEDTVAQAAFGTFEMGDRAPASVQHEDKKSDTHVTEITGSFE